MRPYEPRSRVDTLFALAAASVASVAILGAAVLLFAHAGGTPVFEAGSGLALEASRCGQAPAVQERHRCLRELAAGPKADAPTTVSALEPAALP